MKRNIKSIFLALAALALGFVTACNKDNPDPHVDIVVDYYLGGNEGSGEQSIPVIYKNSAELYRLEKGSSLVGIVKIGNDIIACGNTESKPVLWKNGVPSNTDYSTICSHFSDMMLIAEDVLICGYIENSQGTRHGVILKNDKLLYTSEAVCTYDQMDIGPSGDIYVTGREGNYTRLWRIKTELPAELIRGTIAMDLTDESFTSTDLYVGMKDIVVSVTSEKTVSEEKTSRAYCWLDDELFPISDHGSTAECAALYNGLYFIGGSVGIFGEKKAMEWYNSKPIDMSVGCNADSHLCLLYNGGYNLYQAIASRGQVQLCRNGILKEKIVCAENFTPSAWAIVRIK